MFTEADLETLLDKSCKGMIHLPRRKGQPRVSLCVHTDKVILQINDIFWEANLQEFVEAFQKHL
jgi:hypothetical protein